MAIERGVDDIDIDELDIEDNSKEILLADGSEEDLIFDGMDDEDAMLMDDGTMVFGQEDLMGDMPVPFNANLAEVIDDADLGRIYSDLM